MDAIKQRFSSTIKFLLLAIIPVYLPVSITLAQSSDLVITGVIDGPLTGGVPKAIELYVLNHIADLSLYGLGSANNGGGSDGQEFTFPSVGATAGDFIYVAIESTAFTTFFGFSPNFTSSAASINGDDAIELFQNGTVVDVFGEINMSGTGQPWEYTDGWAYRNHGTGPDGSAFSLSNWSFSGPNALDGEMNNDTAATPFPLGSYTTDGDPPPPPAPELVSIMEIQGAGHLSLFDGVKVATTGIVTAIDANGFYLQDETGDGDNATSDAVFVFTSSAPTGLAIGDLVSVEARVVEFFPGGAGTGNLPTTELVSPTIEKLSSGHPLPAPVRIGKGGRRPPTEVIDDDFPPLFDVLDEGIFDAVKDGIDFFESLEGMRVRLDNPQAVAPRNRFDEIFTVLDNGSNATGLSNRGTLNISPDDFNPERVQIDLDADILPGFDPGNINTGDRLTNVTGVVSYDFGNFQVHPTEPFQVRAGRLRPEKTNLNGGRKRLQIASFNVLNLDPNDHDGDQDIANGRFDAIAKIIVDNLKRPSIVALQEVQDNDGSANTAVTAADVTLQMLVDAIRALGGPRYAFIDNPFIGDDTSGGQPGGNIRTAFIYDPKRVELVADSLQPIVDPDDQQTNPSNPFFDSRPPLAATFKPKRNDDATVTVVNVHFSSKGGSSPIFGVLQPFEANQENPDVNGGVDDRQDQRDAVLAFVNGILGANANANVVVLGDFNEFEFVSPVQGFDLLTNLTTTLPENERYTYIFEGNSQSLDHCLVSNSLTDKAALDIVHVNAEFNEDAARASDHEPLVCEVEIADSI